MPVAAPSRPHDPPSNSGSRHGAKMGASAPYVRRDPADVLASDGRGEFLAMVLHELQNPLASILSAVDVVREGQHAETDRDWLWRGIDNAARRVRFLLTDLVGICHATHPTFRLRHKMWDLVAAARIAVARRQIEFQRDGLTLELQADLASAWVIADPDRMELVIGNLLQNAAKYTEPGGLVTVRVEADGSEVVLRVQDTGVGIAPESLSLVFEPFAREPVASVQRKHGSGVGLFLVRTLVELHGGRAEASSAGRGCGSEFVVRLPAAL